MSDRKRYVLGFMFNGFYSPIRRVVLIQKLRGPIQNIERWNGLGGKIEVGESASEAMVREFEEEAGVTTNISHWHNFINFTYNNEETEDNSIIHCYKTFNSWGLDNICQMEEEPIAVFNIEDVGKQIDLVNNLNWLLPLALNSTVDSGRIHLIEN